MKRFVAIGSLVACGLFTPGVARAEGWYLYWDCVGQCDGYGGPDHGGTGRFGPYATEDDCRYDMNHALVIPADSLFRYYCYEEAPSSSAPPPPAYAPGPSTPREDVTLTSLELAVAGGPGWVARDAAGSTSGRGTVGFDLDARTGPRFFGGSIEVGLQATGLSAPLLGADWHAWYVAPGGVGLVASPRLFSFGQDGSFWLDAGATAVGFVAFGCEGCAAPVFAKTFGFGYALRAGFDVMGSEDAGLSVEIVVPRYAIGSAGTGDLELSSPAWTVRVGVVGRPEGGITF